MRVGIAITEVGWITTGDREKRMSKKRIIYTVYGNGEPLRVVAVPVTETEALLKLDRDFRFAFDYAAILNKKTDGRKIHDTPEEAIDAFIAKREMVITAWQEWIEKGRREITEAQKLRETESTAARDGR